MMEMSEDQTQAFLSRLRGILPALEGSSVIRRYIEKFVKNEHMLYFTTMWFINTWRRRSERGCPLQIMFSAFVRNIRTSEREHHIKEIMALFHALLNADHRKAIIECVHRNKAVPKHLDIMRDFYLILTSTTSLDSESEDIVDHINGTVKSLKIDFATFLQMVSSGNIKVILESYALVRDDSLHRQGKDLLMVCLARNRVDAVITVLKHGFPYFFYKKYYRNCLMYLKRKSIEVDGKPLGVEFKEEITQNKDLRCQMAVEVLNAILSPTMSRRYKKTISLIWKAVPHPFISEQEMFQILDPFFHGHNIKLKDLCSFYARNNNIFPVPAVTTPRSLKHLARVQVRQSMFDGYSLCHEIYEDLRLSKEIGDYVWYLDNF